MARIDVTQVIVNLDGEAMESQDGKEMTLRMTCENALLGMNPQEKITGEQKVERYSLAMKIHEHDEVDLTAEEIAKVKKAVGEVYSPIVVGCAWNLLDPKEEERE